MRLNYLLAAALITTASPAFAQLDWVFAFENGDGNAQHSSSLDITTNPKNYRTVWETQLTPARAEYYSYESSVLIADNKIITSTAYMKTDDHSKSTNINAIDADTGKSLWTVYNPGLNDYDLTYHNGKIITLLDSDTADKSKLTAYDIKSGQPIYSIDVDDNITQLLSYGDSIYFSQDDHAIGSLDPNYGRFNWVKPLDPGKYFKSSLSTNGTYIVTREFDNIRLYDIKTGTELKKIWLPDTPGDGGIQASPIVDNHAAYGVFRSKSNLSSGRLYAFDLSKQKIKWSVPNIQVEYNNVVERTILLTNHIIVAQAYRARQYDADKINFIDADTGKTLWAWSVPDSDKNYATYPMVATADTVFIAGTHHVYALSLTARKVVWSSDKPAYRLYLGANKLFMEWNNEAEESFLTAVALN